MSPLNLITRVRQQLDRLRPAERKVAETILNDLPWAIRASIEEMALRAEVSQPSVTRFCKAIGADNLKNFKLQLAQNLAVSVPYQDAQVVATDTSDTIAHKVCDSLHMALQDFTKQLNHTVLDQAAEALANARRICCVGVGSGSGLVAQDASLRLLRLDLMANYYTDGHLQRLAAGLLEPEDVLFAISLEGESDEILDSATIARERKALVIAITSHYSSLAALADICISLPPSSHGSLFSPGLSRLMQLVVIDILSLSISLREDPAVLEKIISAKKRLKTTQKRKQK